MMSSSSPHSEQPIRLLVPVPYSRPGGVERVLVSLLQAMSQHCDIVFVASERFWQRVQSLMPDATVLQYEAFTWPANSAGAQKLRRLRQIHRIAQRLKLKPLEQVLTQQIDRHRAQDRLQHIVDQYNLTHCLYFLINNVTPPTLSIPVAAIVHDLFWHFSPLSYSADYKHRYDTSLQQWLRSTDQIFAISHRTKADILKIFPAIDSPIRVIPNSGYPTEDRLPASANAKGRIPEFYYPSSFGVYKDQLTFLRAGVSLAQREISFKLTLTGKQTDALVAGHPDLSQQSSTDEFVAYLAQCKALYQEYKGIFESHFSGLGYCSLEEVEACFQWCSCIVVTSKYEGFGLAVSEAIVRGLPVICSDLAVFREQVELYNCEDRIRFFPTGNADALADCMSEFIHSPVERLSAAAASKRFGHWRWANAALAYKAALVQLSK